VDAVVAARGLVKMKIIVMTIDVYKILVVMKHFHRDPIVLNMLTDVKFLVIVVKDLARTKNTVVTTEENVVYAI